MRGALRLMATGLGLGIAACMLDEGRSILLVVSCLLSAGGNFGLWWLEDRQGGPQ